MYIFATTYLSIVHCHIHTICQQLINLQKNCADFVNNVNSITAEDL